MDNFGGLDWSGSGWPSREVLNEINSIPQVKPPSKYSTTRAQPRTHNDLNNAVEGDFHYHNNIENINHNPVQVDDFYYDYNFINFHEDLSDDFEVDGKDSEDGRRLDPPQEDTPTSSTSENAPVESTRASDLFTISKATAHTVNAEEPQSTNLDNVRDGGNAAGNESASTSSEDLDDYFSEDYFLPVSATRSPPLSTTQGSQTPKERQDNVWWPEKMSPRPSLESTTEEPTQDVTWRQYEEENDNNYDYFTEEETLTEDVTVTPKHPAPAPRHQTVISTIVPTTVSTQEEEKGDYDYDEYSYNEERTPGPDISAESDYEENPEPPTPETIIHVKTRVQLDERASEIPQTTSRPTLSPATFPSEDLTSDQTHFHAVYSTSEGESWDSDLYLSTTLSPSPSPSLHTSGNREASDDSPSLTGTNIIPLTNLGGATRPPPAGFLPAATEEIPTPPAFTETTGTDSTSQPPPFDLTDFDYNDILVPPMVRSSDNTDPGSSPRFPTTSATTPEFITKHVASTPPPPPRPRLPVPTSAQTSAATHPTTAAHWLASNWSAVSESAHSPHPAVSHCLCHICFLSGRRSLQFI